jgi:hypothetical protein
VEKIEEGKEIKELKKGLYTCINVYVNVYLVYTYLLVKESEKTDGDSRMIVEGHYLLPAILI